MQYHPIDATSASVVPNTLSPRSEVTLMANAASGICQALDDLMRSHSALVRSLENRMAMMSELDLQLTRNQPHGTEPTTEHVQVRSEVYFLDSVIVRALKEMDTVRDQIERVKESV